MSEVLDVMSTDTDKQLIKLEANPVNQMIESAANLVQELNGNNIRISSNDEKNKLMIQNLKSLVLRQDSTTPYIKLGTLLPEIIENMKQQPELTILFEFFNDIMNNTLENHLTKYFKDEKTLKVIEDYIQLVDNKINSIPNSEIIHRGGSRKTQTGGSNHLSNLLKATDPHNFYTIIGVNRQSLIDNKKFLIYFEFNFSNAHDENDNYNNIKALRNAIDELKHNSLQIIENCAKDIYRINKNNYSPDKKKTERQNVGNNCLDKLNTLNNDFNKLITIEGNMYLIIYNPLSPVDEIAAGPYKAKLEYNFVENAISSFTSSEFGNLHALNSYMQIKSVNDPAPPLVPAPSIQIANAATDATNAANAANTNLQKAEQALAIAAAAAERAKQEYIADPINPNQNKLQAAKDAAKTANESRDRARMAAEATKTAAEIANYAAENEVNSIKQNETATKLKEYRVYKTHMNNTTTSSRSVGKMDPINTANFQEIISEIQISQAIPDHQAVWVIKDSDMPLANFQREIYSLFDRVPIYIVDTGIIRLNATSIVWYSNTQSMSLSQISQHVRKDMEDSFGIFSKTIVTLIDANDESLPQLLADKLTAVTTRVGESVVTINRKMKILNDAIVENEQIIQNSKDKVASRFVMIQFIIVAILMYTYTSSIVSYLSTLTVTGSVLNSGVVKAVTDKFNISAATETVNLTGNLVAFAPVVALLWVILAPIFSRCSDWVNEILMDIYYYFIKVNGTNAEALNNAIEDINKMIASHDPDKIYKLASMLNTSTGEAKHIAKAIKDLVSKTDAVDGGSRKQKRYTKKSRKTTNKRGGKKLKTQNRIKTRKYNKTRKLKMKGGGNNNFILLEIINMIVSCLDLLMFPEHFPIYSTSDVFKQIYQIISDFKIPVLDPSRVVEIP